MQTETPLLNIYKLLEEASNVKINDLNSLIEALQQRIDYFHETGCRIADHGLEAMPPLFDFNQVLHEEFKDFINKKDAKAFSDPGRFTGALLYRLCKIYHEKRWVQQFHLGPLRNNNSRLFASLGPDTGFDSIGDLHQARNLSLFLNELDKTNQLTKTIIYNINPTDNEVFAAMAGNFNDGSVKGKVQFGSAWWFLDQMDGMKKQLNALSGIGIISTFIGMLTDSRSFLSFPRHEYFRRILCNLFGEEMENGLLPNDEKWIGKIISDICYYNAKEYLIYKK